MAPHYVIAIFVAIGVAFIPIGVTLMNGANALYEDRIVYDSNKPDVPGCAPLTKAMQSCSVSVFVLLSVCLFVGED